jgi:hypothetical protein
MEDMHPAQPSLRQYGMHGAEPAGQKRKRPRRFHLGLEYYGGPRAIRTPDPQIRSLMLYPAELWNHLGLRLAPGRPDLQVGFGDSA